MPQLEHYRPSDELRVRVKQLDSAGRTKEQIEAMEKNAYRAPRISERDHAFAELLREEQAKYPKVMYRLALRDGKPAGDEVNPSYAMPFDLAQQVGIPEGQFKVIGKSKDGGGHYVLRHAYQSISVGLVRPDQSVDVEASQKQEKELRSKGWVDRIEDIKGLPKRITDDTFDPLPIEA